MVFLPGQSGVSFEEVCKAITIAEARQLRWRQPVSMANLILKCIQRLELCALDRFWLGAQCLVGIQTGHPPPHFPVFNEHRGDKM